MKLQPRMLLKLKLIALLFLTALVSTVSGQDVFSPVPVAQREHLKERLKILIEYQRNKQWCSLYELLPTINKKNLPESDFINQYNRSRIMILDFNPQFTDTCLGCGIEDSWIIDGCGKWQENDKTVKFWKTELHAFLQDGEWYFSPATPVMSSFHSDPLPCNKSFEKSP